MKPVSNAMCRECGDDVPLYKVNKVFAAGRCGKCGIVIIADKGRHFPRRWQSWLEYRDVTATMLRDALNAANDE